MSSAGHLSKFLGDGVPFAQDQAGKNRLVELLVKGKLSGEEAAIEGCEREFKVIRIESARFFNRAGTGAGAQADVPHALNDGADGLLGLLFGLLVGKRKQDIDVRVRE